MLVANAVTTSFPRVLANSSSNAATTSNSDPVNPGRSMFVLSASSARTPRAPSSANRWKSKCSPSSGVWSILKSPVWMTVPTGVVTASATAPGMLCVTRRNSIERSPTSTRVRGCTGVSRVPASIPWRSSFALTSASVSGVP